MSDPTAASTSKRLNEQLDTVVLAGGGTAGHVNPLLAVAEELKTWFPDVQLRVLGTSTGLETDLVPAHGYELCEIPRVPLPRRLSLDLVKLPFKLRAAVTAAADVINQPGVDAVLGFGGYVSTPAYLAARRARVPIIIHEQNARPGLANRLGARFAAQVGVTFPNTKLPHAQQVGLPLRREIAELAKGDRTAKRLQGAAALGLDPSLPTLLVTGGSSGALSLNAAVAAAASELLAAGAQVLHLTGKGKDGPVRALLAGIPGTERYHIREYLTQMQHAFAVADLVVTRAGAGMVCELAALGLPAILVPLPVGNGEQRLNAVYLEVSGGGIVIADVKFTADWVSANIPPLLNDANRLATMSAAARSCGVTDAATRVVSLVDVAVCAARREGRNRG